MGQFEERLEEILAALRARPEIILFLDELHTIVGAGDTDGRLDAANILKPALARGEIACIGATTLDEYRRHIESDAALERRFQPVLVSEPSPTEAREILAGLRADLERHHGVTIEADAIDAAVELTVRYVPTRRLPDKAVDALDEACARASVPSLTPLTSTADLEPSRRLMSGRVSSAPPPRVRERGAGGEGHLPSPLRPIVTVTSLQRSSAGWTGIPLGQIGQTEPPARSIWNRTSVSGSSARMTPIRQVARRVRMARSGLTDPDRPVGVFLFLGPSGVGKTELARALAEGAVQPAVLRHGVSGTPTGAASLIRLDMSEYAERHQAARLIGAPPGY